MSNVIDKHNFTLQSHRWTMNCFTIGSCSIKFVCFWRTVSQTFYYKNIHFIDDYIHEFTRKWEFNPRLLIDVSMAFYRIELSRSNTMAHNLSVIIWFSCQSKIHPFCSVSEQCAFIEDDSNFLLFVFALAVRQSMQSSAYIEKHLPSNMSGSVDISLTAERV